MRSVRVVGAGILLLVGTLSACGSEVPSSHETIAPQSDPSPTEIVYVEADCQAAQITPGLYRYTSNPDYRIAQATVGSMGTPVDASVGDGHTTAFTPVTLSSVSTIGGNGAISMSTVWVEGGSTSSVTVYGDDYPGFTTGATVVVAVRDVPGLGSQVSEVFPVVSNNVYLLEPCWTADDSSQRTQPIALAFAFGPAKGTDETFEGVTMPLPQFVDLVEDL